MVVNKSSKEYCRLRQQYPAFIFHKSPIVNSMTANGQIILTYLRKLLIQIDISFKLIYRTKGVKMVTLAEQWTKLSDE